jgi:hypothetical protein
MSNSGRNQTQRDSTSTAVLRLTAARRNPAQPIPVTCHAEGRGFESLHPLQEKPRSGGVCRGPDVRRPLELPDWSALSQPWPGAESNSRPAGGSGGAQVSSSAPSWIYGLSTSGMCAAARSRNSDTSQTQQHLQPCPLVNSQSGAGSLCLAAGRGNTAKPQVPPHYPLSGSNRCGSRQPLPADRLR